MLLWYWYLLQLKMVKVSDKSAPQIDKTSEFQLNLQWDRDLWPSITSSTKSFWSGLKYKKSNVRKMHKLTGPTVLHWILKKNNIFNKWLKTKNRHSFLSNQVRSYRAHIFGNEIQPYKKYFCMFVWNNKSLQYLLIRWHKLSIQTLHKDFIPIQCTVCTTFQINHTRNTPTT